MQNAFSLFDRDGDGSINSKVKENSCYKNLKIITDNHLTVGIRGSYEDNGDATF